MNAIRKVDLKQPTMDNFYELAMDTFDTVCNLKVRLGGQYLPKCHFMDGQKYVCMDEMMKDIERQECIVYSFGVDFGWIGHPSCKSKCPTDCTAKTWKYWRGKTGGKGRWYFDTKLSITGNKIYDFRYQMKSLNH